MLDGRKPKQLADILSVSRDGFGGWVIIDGGGNRPAFDEEVAKVVDLCILPFRSSDEDADTVIGKILAAYRIQSRGRQRGLRMLSLKLMRKVTSKK